jgi:hypothetical protein
MQVPKRKIQKNNLAAKAKEISVLDKIQNPSLRETLILIKENTNIKINPPGKLTDPKEIENHFKEELEAYLNEKYKEAYEKVSELREKGHDMMVYTFKMMSIPLKIKLFLSTCNKKDFNIVTSKINEVNKAAENIFEKIRQREEAYKKRKLTEKQSLKAKQKQVKEIAPKKVVKKQN